MRFLWAKLSIIYGDSIAGKSMRLTQIFLVDLLPDHDLCFYVLSRTEKCDQVNCIVLLTLWKQNPGKKEWMCLPAGEEQEQEQYTKVL